MSGQPLPDGFWVFICASIIPALIAGEWLGRFIIRKDDRAIAKRAASCDTQPKAGDVQQAPLVSGAVVSEASETPNHPPDPPE